MNGAALWEVCHSGASFLGEAAITTTLWMVRISSIGMQPQAQETMAAEARTKERQRQAEMFEVSSNTIGLKKSH